MVNFLIFLLIVWLVLSVLGFVIKGLFWLAIIGIVLFLGTSAWLWIKRKATSQG
ncbi:LPXTG-motif cell wall anchor domain-containing protein [Micrococcales bacterium KH10]|nr:LPXTG-motif cell wall anchor domain-containing protein [Micrococcales bacterium KH10]